MDHANKRLTPVQPVMFLGSARFFLLYTSRIKDIDALKPEGIFAICAV